MTDTALPATPDEPTGIVCASVTRRRFLSALGATVVVGAAGGYRLSVWGRDPAASAALVTSTTATTTAPVPMFGDRTLIVVEMGGGNDGLNMVVPHASSRYHDLRGSLAIDTPLDLDGEVGLHPSLTLVADRFAAGEAAIIEGIGYPDPELSHFASMATWWSGIAGSAGQTGWLGRYLDATVGGSDPLAAVSIGPGPTPALLGESSMVVSIQDMTGLAPQIPPWIDTNDDLMGMWQGFAPSAFDGAVLLDQVRAAIDGTVQAASELGQILGAAPQSPQEDGDERQGRRGDLASYMEVAAALATSASPPKIIYVHGWGDFDTHEGQVDRHGAMMTALNDGLTVLFSSIDASDTNHDVVVMTTSEFGRRPAFNGSGTDHGTAAAQLIIGSPVIGGRYGESPSLTALDTRGNMKHTVDYRSLYATVLDEYLGADADTHLAGTYERLGLFAPPQSV